MKHRPNISAKNLKANQYSDMFDKMRNMVLNDETGSTLAERPQHKQLNNTINESTPILNLIKNTELDKIDTFVNMVLNDETGSVLAERPTPIASKVKHKPIPTVQPNSLDNMLDYKLDMFEYITNDTKLHPNKVVEYSTYYVVSIWTKVAIQGYDSLTSKDFDIYINGIRLDVVDYFTWFNERGNLTFTIQKTAITDGLNKENFLICGAFTDIFLATELNKNIIDTENDLGLII